MRVTRLSCKQWLVIGLTLFLPGLALLFLQAALRVSWVGHTDLAIEFIVTDAASGTPVPDATISVHSEGGFGKERGPPDFTLRTDQAGSVKRLCDSRMCSGTAGWGIDTYAVHLPWWFYHVKADGYLASELTGVNIPENLCQIQRGKSNAKLIVRVSLVRKAA